MKLLYLPLLLGYEFSVCICWSHSLGTAMPLLHTDTGCLGAVWIHGHADRVHVSILVNEACPEASLGIRTACCGTDVLVPVPRLACRWKQLSAHCLLVMASLLPSLPDCAWKLLWRSTSSANTGIREQFRVETNGPVLRNLLGLTRIDEH